MTTQLTARHLRVPGATIHYTVRGSGPLLLVVGQPMTSGPFAPLADLLAADRTVVTYDPRGLGGSTVEDREAPVTPELEADDLARVVEQLGGGPADVFGTSGGAVAALALAERRPDLVGTVVAHEPPVTELLPDAPQVRAVVDAVEAAYRADGAGPAWGRFIALVMHDGPVGDDGVPAATWPPEGMAAPDGDTPGSDGADVPGDDGQGAPSPTQAADDELFFLRMLKPFTRWVPPTESLRAGPVRVVVAVGEESRGEAARRSAEALAARLGVAPVVFPGGHAGFMGGEVAFAEALRRALAQPSSLPPS